MVVINYKVMFFIYTIAFLLSLIIEIPIIFLLFSKTEKNINKKKIVKAGFLAQLLTHPLFILIIPYSSILLNDKNILFLDFINNIFVKELLLIPLIEGIFYYKFLKISGKTKAFSVSYAANLISWGSGYLVPWEIIVNIIN